MSKQLKRSRIIIILPMSSLALLSSGCQIPSIRQDQSIGQDQSRIYISTQECIQDGVYGQERCLQQFQQAEQWHRNNAPQFKQKDDCESRYGADSCQSSTSGGTTIYRPYMVGYIAGSSRTSQPIYGSSSQGFRSATGAYLGREKSKNIRSPQIGYPSTKTNTTSPKGAVNRGRFGRSGTSSRGG